MPQGCEPTVVVEPDHVAGIEGESRRRQPERRGLSPDPTPRAAPGGICSLSAGVAMVKVSEVMRSAAPVARRASTLIASYSSSARTSCHFIACGSSVSCSHQLHDLGVGVGARDEVIERQGGGRRSRGWIRITPSLSTASKPKCRASGAIDARGLSIAVIR